MPGCRPEHGTPHHRGGLAIPTYTYRCDKGHTTEMRADPSVTAIACPKCILLAKRIPSWPIYIKGETVAKG